MKQAVIYARVACADEQSDNKIKQQVESCKAVLGDGYDCADIFTDIGYSGLSLDRPGLQKLLDTCKNGKVDLVVTCDTARISRNDDYSIYFSFLLKTYDVDLKTAN